MNSRRPLWRVVMDWFNPIEWFSWLYGKLFQQHFYRGTVVVMVVFAVLGLVLWIRGVDRYKEEHPQAEVKVTGPKTQTVTASNSASQSVTVQGTPTQGVQGGSPPPPANIARPPRK